MKQSAATEARAASPRRDSASSVNAGPTPSLIELFCCRLLVNSVVQTMASTCQSSTAHYGLV
jgi:hypothetical protein